MKWITSQSSVMTISAVAGALAGAYATSYYDLRKQPVLTVAQAWSTLLPIGVLQSKTPTLAVFAVDLANKAPMPDLSFAVEAVQKSHLRSFANSLNFRGALMIENTGRSSATDVHIGLGYVVPRVQFSINSSPNVSVVATPGYPPSSNQQDNIHSPTFVVVKIENLPPGETAIVNLAWDLSAEQQENYVGIKAGDAADVELPKLTQLTVRFSPPLPQIYYINSKEVRGSIDSILPIDNQPALRKPELRPFMSAVLPGFVLPSGAYTFTRFRPAKNGLVVHEESGHAFRIKSE